MQNRFEKLFPFPTVNQENYPLGTFERHYQLQYREKNQKVKAVAEQTTNLENQGLQTGKPGPVQLLYHATKTVQDLLPFLLRDVYQLQHKPQIRAEQNKAPKEKQEQRPKIPPPQEQNSSKKGIIH